MVYVRYYGGDLCTSKGQQSRRIANDKWHACYIDFGAQCSSGYRLAEGECVIGMVGGSGGGGLGFALMESKKMCM